MLTSGFNVFSDGKISQYEWLMNEAITESSRSISNEQKQAALESVLHSNTFARADQLKSFLKYVCEMEIAGRGHELTEYLIGVEALGRPSNYSTGDDSAVRNRAFALRKKLQEFYELEQPEAEIRIEMTKGSYCPHFVVSHSLQGKNGKVGVRASHTSGALVQPDSAQEIAGSRENVKLPGGKMPLLSFVAGVIVSAIIFGAIFWLMNKPRPDVSQHEIAAVVAEAWGPIFNSESDVLVCVANPPSFSIHPRATPLTPATVAPTPFLDPGGFTMPQELYPLYNTKYSASPKQDLFLTITTNATYWGDSLAAMTMIKTILPTGATPHLFPEKVITMPTLRRRNVVLFGAPEYSPVVARFLDKCPLTLNFLDAIVEIETGKPPVKLYSVKRDSRNSPAVTYGLITVLPSESSTNQQHRTVIFSGVNSAGTQAAAEFFTSADHLAELKRQLTKDGHKTFPAAYQVVVRSETDDSILLNFSYETYRIIRTFPN